MIFLILVLALCDIGIFFLWYLCVFIVYDYVIGNYKKNGTSYVVYRFFRANVLLEF